MNLPKSDRLRRLAATGRLSLTVVALAASLAAFLPAQRAFALSELKREELPALSPSQDDVHVPAVPDATVPTHDPLPNAPTGSVPGEREDPEDIVRPGADPDMPLPEIIYNLDRLPEPVRRMRDLIVEAAKSGDIERLRPLIGIGDGVTQLSFGGVGDDPIAFLKELSGDSEGHEILAILEEVLSAGYVHLDAGTPHELYVWPYFFAMPLDGLDPRQRVELFKIVTAGDYEDMEAFGAYIFYRVGITPEGRWAFFVAGD